MNGANPTQATRGLGEVAVVLVGTRGAVNLGSAARLCANFGCGLRLVRPEVAPDAPEARQYATHAEHVLAAAPVLKDLESAVADCALVIGTSANARRDTPPERLTEGLGRDLLTGLSERAPLALVFGDERDGLARADLERCHRVVNLHAPGPHPSFNLSHAVAIALAALAGGRDEAAAIPTEARASADELAALEARALAALSAAGYFRRTPEAAFASEKLRPLLGRMSLRSKDATLLATMFAVLKERASPAPEDDDG